MRNRRKRVAGVLIALCCALVLTAYGRVFLRWGAAGRCARTLREAGGQQAYASRVVVNGGNGDLHVFSFETGIGDLVKRLATAFGMPGLAYRGGDMATGFVRAEGRVVRLTVVRFSRSAQTLVFALSQAAADFDESRTLRREDIPRELPLYPGAKPLFLAQHEKSGMHLLVSKARADAGAVQSALRAQLAGDGWEPFFLETDPAPASPRDRGGHQLSVQFYLKPGRLCCVHAGPTLDGDQTRITVLQKQQQMP